MKSIRSSKSQATVDRVSYIYFCQNSKRHFQNKSRFYLLPKVGLESRLLTVTNCSTFDALIQSWNDIDLLSLFYSQCSFGPKEARRPSAKQAGKPLFKFSLTFSCSKFRETQGMRPTQQTDQNFIAWHNALYCIVHCKMYGMDILSMSLAPYFYHFWHWKLA